MKTDINNLTYSHTDIMQDSKFIVFNINSKITTGNTELVYPALYIQFSLSNNFIDTHIHCTETEIDIYNIVIDIADIIKLCDGIAEINVLLYSNAEMLEILEEMGFEFKDEEGNFDNGAMLDMATNEGYSWSDSKGKWYKC